MNEDEKRLFDTDKSGSWKISLDSIQKMNAQIIKNINDHVAIDDVLWCMGDFCFAPEPNYFESAKALRDRITCQTIHFIRGNHDNFNKIAPLFSSAHEHVHVSIDSHTGKYWIGYDDVQGIKEARRGQQIVMNHCAMAVWMRNNRGAWNLYGHSHSSAEAWLENAMPGRKAIDVGIDNIALVFGEGNAEDYRPVSFDELKIMMDKRPGVFVDHHKK